MPALALLSIAKFGLTIDGVGGAVLCFLLLGLAVMDAETMVLPDSFTLPGLALGLLHAALAADSPLLHRLSDVGGALLAAAIGGLVMLVVRWSYWLLRRRHGLGLGDVKLVAMIAAWLGVLPMVLTFLLAALAASLTGLAALGLRSRPTNRQEDSRVQRIEEDPASWQTLHLPLGAFLCAAALFVLFSGRPILDWYMGFFR